MPTARRRAGARAAAGEGRRPPAGSRTNISCLVLDRLKRRKVGGMDPATFMFGRGGTPHRSDDLHRDWCRARLAAGVRYRGPEQLRHTFASTMLGRSAPPVYVAEVGGWSSAHPLLMLYAGRLPAQTGMFAMHVHATQAQPGTGEAKGSGSISAGLNFQNHFAPTPMLAAHHSGLRKTRGTLLRALDQQGSWTLRDAFREPRQILPLVPRLRAAVSLRPTGGRVVRAMTCQLSVEEQLVLRDPK
jgi:hypothetical protein